MPVGKLLDPCTLLPVAEVMTASGSEIRGDERISVWIPGTRKSIGDGTTFGEAGAPILADRALYECRFHLDGQWSWLTVEVFADAQAAAEQMDSTLAIYNRYLSGEIEGTTPMVEVAGVGDRAYALKPTTTLMRSFPALYVQSGSYLIRLELPSPSASLDSADVRALAVAQNAVAALPADIHASMGGQEPLIDDPGQPPGKALEPCSLITRSEAQSFFDVPLESEDSDSFWGLNSAHDDGTYSCSYAAGSAGGIDFDVTLYFDPGVFIAEMEEAGTEEVSGLGDRAYNVYPATSRVDIMVLSGNYVIWVDDHVFGHDRDTQYQTAFKLAELILGRLP